LADPQVASAVVAIGDECNPFDQAAPAFCPANSVCEYGICRGLCGSDTDCGEAEECIDFTDRVEGINYKFCQPTCDIYAQDCAGEGEVCVLTDAYAGRILGSCTDGMGAVSGEGQNGDACTESAENFWGDCAANNLCTDFYGNGEECVSFCDNYSLDACDPVQACLTGLLRGGLDDIGLCAGQCNSFTDEGCGEGQSCIFGNVGAGSERVEQVIGFCADNPNGGQVATGEVCEDTLGDDGEPNGTSNCAPGHICAVTEENAPPVCIELCQDENPEGVCAEGTSCQKVFDPEFVVTVGVCL
jgi:hypothetical protein